LKRVIHFEDIEKTQPIRENTVLSLLDNGVVRRFVPLSPSKNSDTSVRG